MTTDQKLIEVAAKLLDAGGEEAVTLRAVGHAAGLSHNAPYKHFASRSALLAAVATVWLDELAQAVAAIRMSRRKPIEKLRSTIELIIDYRHRHPARFKLLFNSPETAAAGGELKAKALDLFEQVRAIVQQCQEAGKLPQAPSQALASLIFATAHGLLAIESNGGLHPEKGLSSVPASMELLLKLLSPAEQPSG